VKEDLKGKTRLMLVLASSEVDRGIDYLYLHCVFIFA